ncbi:MAG: c-type cytochrome [Acidobacteria bacterium]|nr:c-type cytochrome [Acidobacteriota bacterium]MBI3661569.1 c-type cytochrome [Acidobacteriota bacterium]
MKSWIKLGLVLSVALALPLVAMGGGDVEKGKALYTSKCATCHAPGGEGKPAMAKAMKVEFRHLGSKEVQAKKDAELKKDFTEGNGKMKPVKLTDEEAANVIAFLRTLKK